MLLYCVEVNLSPPGLSVGTEVSLSPGAEKDGSGLIGITVGKSKGKGGGSTNDSASGGVLRSMARAHELVVGGRPRDDASQVGAHGVEAVGLKGSIILDDKVGGIALKSLSEGVVTGLVGGKVLLLVEVVSKGILGGDSAVSTSGARGEEEEDVGNGKASNGHGGGADEDEVHEVPAVLVDVELALGGGHAHGSNGLAA